MPAVFLNSPPVWQTEAAFPFFCVSLLALLLLYFRCLLSFTHLQMFPFLERLTSSPLLLSLLPGLGDVSRFPGLAYLQAEDSQIYIPLSISLL